MMHLSPGCRDITRMRLSLPEHVNVSLGNIVHRVGHRALFSGVYDVRLEDGALHMIMHGMIINEVVEAEGYL